MKRAIFTVDWHYPLVHKSTLKALLHFLEGNQVDTFIFGGDQHDNAEISHHNKNKPLFKPPGAFVKNTDDFERDVLTPIEERLSPEAKRIWIIGNHERFADDMVEEHPELAGMFDRVALYRLRERGFEIVPLGHAYVEGKLSYMHGEWLTGVGNQAGAFPAKKLVEVTATNTLAGHTHTAQSFTRISPVAQTDKWMGWISPIMGETNPAYLRNRPTAWLNGFTIVEYHGNGETFNCFPIVAIDGRFSYGGTEYSANGSKREKEVSHHHRSTGLLSRRHSGSSARKLRGKQPAQPRSTAALGQKQKHRRA